MHEKVVGETAVIALIPNDVVGPNMAGPGIRMWEFARVLSKQFQVHIIIPPTVAGNSAPVAPHDAIHLIICHNQTDLRQQVQQCDIIVTRGVTLTAYPFLAQLGKPLVLDMYNTFVLEGLQQMATAEEWQRITTHERDLESLNTQLRVADFILCASEKQRDYWLGVLSALGRVNPYTHHQDHSLRQLIDVVPFGLPQEAPRQTKPVLKGVYKNIAPNDKVILWSGGIWNWLDAETLIRAMHLIQQERNDVKLFFMGIKRPNSSIAKLDAVERAIHLSQELKLTDRSVYFNDWVPYHERQNYLLEADIGVSLHLDHIETRFSFRTRLLDHLWVGLPTIATKGDVMGELLAHHGLARLCIPGDVEGIAQAILEWADTPNLRTDLAAQFHQVANQFQWEIVTKPLVDFCQMPHFAPDKQKLQFSSQAKNRSLFGKGWNALQLGGFSGLWQEVRNYWQWKTSRG